jgi:hypothetical protein
MFLKFEKGAVAMRKEPLKFDTQVFRRSLQAAGMLTTVCRHNTVVPAGMNTSGYKLIYHGRRRTRV